MNHVILLLAAVSLALSALPALPAAADPVPAEPELWTYSHCGGLAPLGEHCTTGAHNQEWQLSHGVMVPSPACVGVPCFTGGVWSVLADLEGIPKWSRWCNVVGGVAVDCGEEGGEAGVPFHFLHVCRSNAIGLTTGGLGSWNCHVAIRSIE